TGDRPADREPVGRGCGEDVPRRHGDQVRRANRVVQFHLGKGGRDKAVLETRHLGTKSVAGRGPPSIGSETSETWFPGEMGEHRVKSSCPLADRAVAGKVLPLWSRPGESFSI